VRSPSDHRLYRFAIADGSGTVSHFVKRAVSVPASFGAWPYGVIRLGVVLCVGLAVVIALSTYSEALDGNDFWADRNSALDYTARSVPFSEGVGSPKVAEDARLWMPEDASYRIVTHLQGPLEWSAPGFLAGFLLPRRQTASDDTPWVFCYQCDTSALQGFVMLSDGGNGVLFGRTSR